MQTPDSILGEAALVILCIAVIGGAVTAYMRLTDKNISFDTGLLHGRAGVIGTILLIFSFVIGNETGESLKLAIGLLVLTVLGGVALYFIIRRKGILPKSIIFLHGVFAVTAVYTVLFGFPFQI